MNHKINKLLEIAGEIEQPVFAVDEHRRHLSEQTL